MTDRPGDASDEDELDAEALSWAGDEERGVAPPGARARREQRGADPDGLGEPEADGSAPEADEPPPPSPGRTVATAVFVVVYLLITVGWVMSVQRTASGSTELLVEISWQFGEFLAMASGVLAFGTVFSLTRRSATLVSVGWWLLGALLLVPWPILLLLYGEAR